MKDRICRKQFNNLSEFWWGDKFQTAVDPWSIDPSESIVSPFLNEQYIVCLYLQVFNKAKGSHIYSKPYSRDRDKEER